MEMTSTSSEEHVGLRGHLEIRTVSDVNSEIFTLRPIESAPPSRNHPKFCSNPTSKVKETVIIFFYRKTEWIRISADLTEAVPLRVFSPSLDPSFHLNHIFTLFTGSIFSLEISFYWIHLFTRSLFSLDQFFHRIHFSSGSFF
ncbi:hypothetical protein OJAV_G00218250 [Oryzias javanicus]|uniref:Uncharacterized protein n=1 Tax=Oryzias javanicus TaxID=123683 RepID=A0A3S2NVR5_ORYJA|nr:hypothetical protein OJAV_G00218250 [Oryzias javanicus]